MAIDKIDIASKNWAEDYLTENGRRFNNMLRDAFITGFKKGVQLSRRTEKWIEHEWAEEYDGRLISNYECSECKSWERERTNYCPNCGARMKGEGDE